MPPYLTRLFQYIDEFADFIRSYAAADPAAFYGTMVDNNGLRAELKKWALHWDQKSTIAEFGRDIGVRNTQTRVRQFLRNMNQTAGLRLTYPDFPYTFSVPQPAFVPDPLPPIGVDFLGVATPEALNLQGEPPMPPLRPEIYPET